MQNNKSSADPYSEIICTECKTSNDDELLLLCDLCDIGSHTYCVGLGKTVPKGDWFCTDCTISKNEHSKLDVVEDEPSVSETSYQDPLSNHDVVRDNNNIVISRVQKEYRKCSEPYSQQNARTLSRHRFVGEHVRRLRGNWDGMQNASVSSRTNCNSNPVQPSTAENSTVRDVKKAWEMMDAARKIIKKLPNTLTDHKNSVASKCPGPSKINGAKDLVELNSTPLIRKTETSGHRRVLLGSGMRQLKFQNSEMQKSNDPTTNERFQNQEHQFCSRKSLSHSVVSVSEIEGSDSQSTEMQKSNDHATKKRVPNQREFPDINFGKRSKLYSEYDFSSNGTMKMSQISNKKSLCRDTQQPHVSCHSSSLIIRSSGCPVLSAVEEKHHECSERGENSEKLKVDNSTNGNSTQDINNAKSEIQSLVKRTMKPFLVDKRIGKKWFLGIMVMSTTF